ncbi:hypothetical protein LZ31DRAFT_33515 [Colletotrichum somersetense]|nr:hypothetical protein LZ31DRAFT_33515 [Colletotrichum somersetense]
MPQDHSSVFLPWYNSSAWPSWFRLSYSRRRRARRCPGPRHSHFCTPRRQEEATVPTRQTTPSTHIELGLPTAKEDIIERVGDEQRLLGAAHVYLDGALAYQCEDILPCSPSRRYAVSGQGWINGKHPCRKPLAPETRRLERAGRPERTTRWLSHLSCPCAMIQKQARRYNANIATCVQAES